MAFAHPLRILTALLILAAAIPLLPQEHLEKIKTGTPTESEHKTGPHGLQGWTLNWLVPGSGQGDEKLPLTLVVARDGHVLRRVDGDPFVWQWIFWADGQQVAYESGPLHFGLACVLYDLGKGRELSRIDCYHALPADAPAWVRALEAPNQK